MNRYTQRDAVLRDMGYSSYAEYLASPLWNKIRGRIFKVCSTCPCGEVATEVHHRTYKRRYMEGHGKIHKFLVPVCRACHQRIEFADGAKTSLGNANRALDAIVEEGVARGVVRPRKCMVRISLPLSERPKCPTCGKRCKTETGLAAHIRNVHQRRKVPASDE